MGVLAAAAIFASWKIDTNTAILVGSYIIAFGVLLIFLSFILDESHLRRAIAWATTGLIFIIAGCFLFSAVVVDQKVIKPVECLVRFWEPCEGAKDGVADRNAENVEVKTPQEVAQNGVDRARYTVLLQFAGYKRPDMVTFAQSLKQLGWQVAGGEKGGERTADADRLAEVRYRSAAEKSAAEQLAAEINATGVKSNVAAKPVSVVAPDTLEIWIGQN